MSFAPDSVFGTGFAKAIPVPTLPTVGTTAQVKTSLDRFKTNKSLIRKILSFKILT
jgi:hypothetical protein